MVSKYSIIMVVVNRCVILSLLNGDQDRVRIFINRGECHFCPGLSFFWFKLLMYQSVQGWMCGSLFNQWMFTTSKGHSIVCSWRMTIEWLYFTVVEGLKRIDKWLDSRKSPLIHAHPSWLNGMGCRVAPESWWFPSDDDVTQSVNHHFTTFAFYNLIPISSQAVLGGWAALPLMTAMKWHGVAVPVSKGRFMPIMAAIARFCQKCEFNGNSYFYYCIIPFDTIQGPWSTLVIWWVGCVKRVR